MIDELRQVYPLKTLLRAARMPRSTWYYNLKMLRLPDKHAALKGQIIKIYNHHKGRYGYRRILLSLRKLGYRINHKTVQRLMSECSIRAIIRVKKYRSFRGSLGKPAANVMNRKFEASSLNEKWVTDVTEFNVRGEKLYLSPIMDLCNREIISYSMSDRPLMGMVNDMLDKAFTRLTPGTTPVLHTDQGWQYQMASYQDRLKDHDIVQSMSRKGNCLDNAVIESFFGTLKSECFRLNKFKSINELRESIEQYIHYYNNERMSLKLNGMSPVEYRTQVLTSPMI